MWYQARVADVFDRGRHFFKVLIVEQRFEKLDLLVHPFLVEHLHDVAAAAQVHAADN